MQDRFGMKLIETDDDQFLCCIGGVHEGHAQSDENYEVVMEYEG